METLHDLLEMFYNYKNETLDLLSDDDLLDYMKKNFDGKCQGSVELLSGRELANMARNKRHLIDSSKLSGEFYFADILREAHACRLLSDLELENIQWQCLNLLAAKSEKYTAGDSSSLRVENAETIMQSNLYTIGLYLKIFPDAEWAVNELKTATIPEIYQKGRRLINAKIGAARHIYKLVQKNKLTNPNHSYNDTLANGIGDFFKLYNPEFEAHEIPAMIDYQLCHPVTGLVGIEYIQKYLANLYLENEFCGKFPAKTIHHLLTGYDEGYRDLLINIFEHVLTAALGCSLAKLKVLKLDISPQDIRYLTHELAEEDSAALLLKFSQAAKDVLAQLKITDPLIQGYIEKSLPLIVATTFDKTFVPLKNPALKPKVRFSSGAKMADQDYRQLVNELLMCRYSADKMALIKAKIRSFGDLEDLLLDAQLSKDEISMVLDTLQGDLRHVNQVKLGSKQVVEICGQKKLIL